MTYTSSAIRRWSWLTVLAMVGVVVPMSVLGRADLQLSLEETCQLEEGNEEFEVDDLCELLATSTAGRFHYSLALFGQVAELSSTARFSLSLRPLGRGPPFC